jgi:hypothetical protein
MFIEKFLFNSSASSIVNIIALFIPLIYLITFYVSSLHPILLNKRKFLFFFTLNLLPRYAKFFIATANVYADWADMPDVECSSLRKCFFMLSIFRSGRYKSPFGVKNVTRESFSVRSCAIRYRRLFMGVRK